MTAATIPDPRPSRPVTIEGASWTLFDAGRASSGIGLGYFAAGQDAGRDRRVELDPGTDVSALDDDAVAELWARGYGLTVTERRFTDDEGVIWLAQSVGPVWADGGVAAGIIGTRLRCISHDRPVVEKRGLALGTASDGDLIEAVTPEETPADD